ncbi:tRNA 2-thiouridine(34) synthase MnmA [uncultured Brachyspira sp.]|uniref:tRNA 2-thiouridine(34) synthase MnmA n=1 Tax=uncultured Brachyspira sp. TaxID=221953 RepID=UPI0025D4ABFB|nr:tRNA 2-thiouridine(34) synthase MnmA [uncultured Brachyspira sp.]
MQKIAVGMSAGVDSTTAAKLLKEQGNKVFGVSMLLWNGDNRAPLKGSCYSPSQLNMAEECKRYAEAIGIDYYAFDISDIFQKKVIDYVSESYKKGLTPNPCIMCNSQIKFMALFEAIEKQGLEFDKFATGHYAGIKYDEKTKRYLLLRGKNLIKDQSYFLYRLTQNQLSKIIFPMYENTKEDTRNMARKYNLEVSEKSESQDFFAGEYHRLFDEDKEGFIINIDTNEILGKHKGIWHYTVGQRKGLGIAYKEPLFIISLDSATNTVYVGNKSHTFVDEVTIYDSNWIAEPVQKEFEALVKTRSAHKGSMARVIPIEENIIRIKFFEPAGIVAKGQSCVCYDEDIVLCGGIVY